MATRIIRAADGEVLGPIAGPGHRHTREDEFSYTLEGRVWAEFDGEEHVAEVGDLVFKPRGEWHTFWNASDQPARLLGLIAPGGLEALFRAVDTATEDVDLGPIVSATD